MVSEDVGIISRTSLNLGVFFVCFSASYLSLLAIVKFAIGRKIARISTTIGIRAFGYDFSLNFSMLCGCGFN